MAFVEFVLGLFGRLVVVLVYMDITQVFIGLLVTALGFGLYLAAAKTAKS